MPGTSIHIPLPRPSRALCADSDVSWEDIYHEDNQVAWFDWVRTSLILLHLHQVTLTRRVIAIAFPLSLPSRCGPP